MFIKRKRTILEKLLICSVIALHINLILPMSDFLPLPKAIKKAIIPEAHAAEPPAPSWSVVEVHDGVDPSLAIDNSGKSHISFGVNQGSDGWPTDIYYAYKENNSWQSQQMVWKPTACAETSIFLDSNSKVHIGYATEYGQGVWYRTNKSGSWQDDTLKGTWTGNYESMCTDDNGKFHAAYWNNNSGAEKIHYMFYNGAGWQAAEGTQQNVDTDIKEYSYMMKPVTVLATHGPNPVPYVIAGRKYGGLKYYYKSNGSWFGPITFGDTYNILQDPNGAMAFDSNNNLYCIVQTTSNPTSLILAKNTGGTWSYGTIVQLASGSLVRASLVIDSQNNLHIAYFNGQKVYYGTKSTGAWAFQEAAAVPGGYTPGDISLALNSSGKPRIAYSALTATSKKIYYAEWDIHLPNNPPIMDPIPAQTASENELLTFIVKANDTDIGDIITYSLLPITGKNYPTGAVLNSTSGVFEWTPTYKQAGYYEATAKVNDDKGFEDSKIIKITVLNVNTKPTVEITPSSFCVTAGTDFTLHINANAGGDGDTLTYALKENGTPIQNGTIVPPEQLPDITRNQTTTGIYEYTITVSDPDSESATASCSVEVIDANENTADSFPISGDFNGDGITDIGTFNTKTGDWKVALSDKGKFNGAQLWMSNLKGKDPEQKQTLSLTGDFNSDGRTDIALYDRQGGDWKFAFSDGTSFIRNDSWNITGFGGGECSPLIGDFNGDGITDIGYCLNSSDKGYFSIKFAKLDKTGFGEARAYKTDLADRMLYAGDFNGDGLTDIGAFESTTGTWRVFITQDASSNNLIDLVQADGVTGGTTGNINHGSSTDAKDGDWGSYCGFYDGGSLGSKSATVTTLYEWPSTEVERINFKCQSGSAVAEGGTHGNSWSVYLKLDGNWVLQDSGSSEWVVRELQGPWQSCGGIMMVTSASADHHSGRECAILASNFEVQAWHKPTPSNANDLITLDNSGIWASGFGLDKEVVLTDYNHDGKTDIGYFDGGEWRYAISSGAEFDSMIKATMGSINNGSHANVYDGDWDTWVGFYDGGSYGSKSSTTTTVFEWPDIYINSVKYRCASSSAHGGTGSDWNNWDVYLKINGTWVSIDNGSGDSGIKTNSSGWANCGGIKMETRALADSNRECSIGTKNYEVQAFTTLPDSTEVNKAVGTNWPSPFPLVQGSDILPSGGDFNGDGIGDAAVFHKDRQGVLNKWEIKLHNSKQPDLLVVIDNGIGGATNIEYEVSTQFDNTGGDGKPDLPFPLQVVKRETKSDGMGSTYGINYEYKYGKFEPNSREFRGFGQVKAIDSEGTVKETQFYQDDDFKGRPEEEIVEDANGRLYSRVQYEWTKMPLYGGMVTFPYMVSTTSSLYDFKGTIPINEVKTSYSNYDEYGNAGRIDELGFIGDPSDDRYTVVEYEYNTAKYIVGKPKHTTIMKGTTKVSEAWYRYDSFGSLKEEEKWLDIKPAGGSNPITKFKYDYEADANKHSGNLVEVEDSLGRKTTTNYDASYQYTFPVLVTNTLGHTQSFTYDPKTGQILTSTDPNGQITRTIYDSFGRTQKVIGPNDTEASPGIEYFYDLSLRPVRIKTITKVDTGVTSTSYGFMDSLGRTVEVKTDAENPGEQMISGIVKYDSRGQVKEKYLAYFVTASPDYVPPDYAQLKVTYFYDPIGRVIETKRLDNISSFVQYDGWIVTTIDENGHKMTSEKDAFGRLIKVTEYNTAETYLTQYQYDVLGNLKKTIDSKNNETSITYDSLGRKTAMDDLDMGHWEYGYDVLGNLKKQTDAKGQVIEFDYDAINRLRTKSLRVTAGGETISAVQYTYDEPGKPNCVGRLSKVTDSSGTTEFFYDNLGRELKTIKSVIASPPEAGEATPYTVSRTYDSIDRLKTVTYPDGEVLTYTYNKAGGVETVSSPSKTYITNVDYNENGQMTRIDYGNGTHTEYSYNSETLRLENLITQGSSGNIQNLTYTFDNVGNVKSITDASNGTPAGTNTQSFEYDDLSRLTKATGASYGIINYRYDSIGNMLQNGNITLMEYGVTAGPHAVTHYTKNSTRYAITYDSNGNMLSKETETGARTFIYDIENRLTEATSPQETYISNYTINLNAGWNFVSLPVIVTEDIPTIFAYSGITKAQVSRYNSETQAWENFAYEQGKDLTEYNDFITFDYGRGYEIYVDTASTLKVSGITSSTGKTLDLKTGWNLITAPTTTSIDATTALNGVTYSNICERQGNAYVPVTQLKGGKGYFLKVSSNQTWNIPSEGEKTSFIYDGDGGRVKVITSERTTTYIGSSYEIEIKGTETKISKHIFLGSTRICTVENDGAATKYRYYHQDHIGSSNVITDETGAIAKLIEYSPYGLTSREEGAYNTNYKFTGKLFDTSTALYYYGARYYDPELGRFISPDSIVPYPSDPQSFNRYAYARNNPIRYVDPTGHSWWDSFKKWIGNIVGAVVGVVVGVATGNFWLGFQAYSITSSIVNAGITGNWGGLAGGIAGGLIGGAFGVEAATWGGALLTGAAANSFLGGFITGAIEFGASGFGAGFGSAIGSGASFGDAMSAGLFTGGISAVAGGVLQGSYMAGWQSFGHGASPAEQMLKRIELAKETGNWAKVYNFLNELPPAAQRSWALYHSKAMIDIRSNRSIGEALFKSYGNMLQENDLVPIDFNDSLYNEAYVRAVNKWTFAESYLAEEKQDVWETTRTNWFLNPRHYSGTPQDMWKEALKIAY